MSDARESHWCYPCNKHVAVGTSDDIVLCCECNEGFVTSVQPVSRDWDDIMYLDARSYISQLETIIYEDLAEGDDGGGGGGGRRGAPPAAKSAIEALETFEVGSTCNKEGERMVVVCAVCKDRMVIGEIGKKLPCRHSYHGNCILPWLETRNSCPVCRFQLQTDDAEYERKRAREEPPLTDSSSAASSSSSKRGRKEKKDHNANETIRRSIRKRKPNRKYKD